MAGSKAHSFVTVFVDAALEETCRRETNEVGDMIAVGSGSILYCNPINKSVTVCDAQDLSVRVVLSPPEGGWGSWVSGYIYSDERIIVGDLDNKRISLYDGKGE